MKTVVLSGVYFLAGRNNTFVVEVIILSNCLENSLKKSERKLSNNLFYFLQQM